MKKIFWWILGVLLAPVLLFAVLAGLLCLTPVQNWAVDKVAEVVSEKLDMHVTVGHVQLSFPLDLALDDFKVIDDIAPTASGDTIMDVQRLVADVQLRPLFDNRVVVNKLEIQNTSLNTRDFIAAARVKGRFSRLAVNSRGIDLDLARQSVEAYGACLEDAQVDILLRDSVPEDTTTTKTLWVIRADSVSLLRSSVALHSESDSLDLRVGMGRFVARQVLVDLGQPEYSVGSADWADGAFRYNTIDMPMLALHTGRLSMRGDTISAPSLCLKTPDSSLSLNVGMPLSFTDSISPGQLQADVDAQLSRHDLMSLFPALPAGMKERWPLYPLTVKGRLRGNMKLMDVSGLNVELPTAFALKADGTMANLNQVKRLRADVQLSAQTQNLAMVLAALPRDVQNSYRLPPMTIDGHLKVDGAQYGVDAELREDTGLLSVDGSFDADAMRYDANVSLQQMDIKHFMPHGDLHTVSADITAQGQGTDLFSPSTMLRAEGTIDHLGYTDLNLDAMTIKADVSQGRARAHIDSRNALVNGIVAVDALMSRKKVDGTVTADVSHIDFRKLHVTDKPFDVGLCGHIDITSDTKLTHTISGYFNDLTLRDSLKVYRPTDIGLLVKTRPDTTCLRLQSGDFIVKLDGSGSYERLLTQCRMLGDTIAEKYSRNIIDQQALRRLLPTMKLHVESKQDNPIAAVIKSVAGTDFKDLLLDMSSSVETGLNGNAYIEALTMDDMLLDTINLRIIQRRDHLSFGGLVRNNKRNPGFVFSALFDGVLQEHGATVGLRYYDAAQKLGARIGAQAEMVDSGLRLHLVPERPTIGYKEFNLNSDNYILLGQHNRVQTKIDLVADDGTGVKIFSEGGDPTALQDITVSLNRLNLGEISSVVPYMPRMTGSLNGDYHVVQDAEGHLSVVSDMAVWQMTYEGSHLGNLSTELVYLQKEGNAHALDAHLMKDDVEVGVVTGTYYNEGDGSLDARLIMQRTPLSLVNGFIDDHIFGLSGYGEGELTIKGKLTEPHVDGEIYLDSSYIESKPYGMTLRFDNDPVRIVDSKLLLENFTVYAHNNEPLNVQGDINFGHLDRVTANVRMRARDFQIIGAKENQQSIVYGKAFVNVFATMRGPLDNLLLRGRIDVLGSTDMSYVLRDSPLTTDNQLNELVKFTNFGDTAAVVVERPSLDGLQMDMTVDVSKGAHIMAYLNADHSNYIDLNGGGTLRMQYTPTDNLQLRGRYTLSNGEMKYSLPVIPLKTFTIQDGSYIEFTGEPTNPTLNITATERTKAAVSTSGGVGRSVDFDCGVKITHTLKDMGLEFTLDAPEDMQLHGELQSMGVEQRGKLAVSMLTTGMYLADGNTSGFSMNSALSSFLSSEISNITGNALRTLDLSFGMDNSVDASGAMHTDYSFKFAKRFMNNRLKVAVGGLVSTGSSYQPRNNSFFDNVSLEYRLDQTANKFVTLYYQNNSYDWLDGYTQKYGGGFTWRRSMQSFWDIFRFKDPATPGRNMPLRQTPGQATLTTPSPTDSVEVKKKQGNEKVQ